MKPAPFEYLLPRDLPHALQQLAEHNGNARLLAGGQSLMPLLNMRLANPSLVVDINRLAELSGVLDAGDVIRIGATTRYHELEASGLIAAELPLLRQALKQVAHSAVRNRGTLGGSLALADPAGEMPACALALDATIIARSVRGERRIPVGDFLRGVWETALDDDEMIVCVEYPKRGGARRFAFLEYSRRQGDFALAGVILDVGGTAGARCVLFGVGRRAFRVPAVEAWLDADPEAVDPTPQVHSALVDAVLGAADEPTEAAFRATIGATLFARALRRLARAGDPA